MGAIPVMLPLRGAVSVVGELINRNQVESQGSHLAKTGSDIGFGPVQNLSHLPSQAVGLVDPLNLRIAIAGAEETGELAVSVQALVVHLDHKHVIEPGKNVFQ